MFCFVRKAVGEQQDVLFRLLQFWRERETTPSQKAFGRGEELLQRAAWGTLFYLTHTPKTGAELLGNSRVWHWAMTSPLGPHRASLGSQQEWFRTWSWALKTAGLREVWELLSIEYITAGKMRWGRSGKDCCLFFLFQVLCSLCLQLPEVTSVQILIPLACLGCSH